MGNLVKSEITITKEFKTWKHSKLLEMIMSLQRKEGKLVAVIESFIMTPISDEYFTNYPN